MALRSGFRAEIGHFRDVPMWVNGKTADLAEKIKPLFWGHLRAARALRLGQKRLRHFGPLRAHEIPLSAL